MRFVACKANLQRSTWNMNTEKKKEEKRAENYFCQFLLLLAIADDLWFVGISIHQKRGSFQR
jgi:hypothetical protein